MPYKFTYDISKVPRFFFTEIALIGYQKGMHKKFLKTLQDLIKKFRIQEATGLNLSDAVVLLQDLIDLQAVNLLERGKFLQTKKRALFLPHCSRKYMDKRCQADFDQEIPTYRCAHCSPDCLINKSTQLGEGKGYDVYVLPGGTCLPTILKRNAYEGVVGVACSQELKQVDDLLKTKNVSSQGVFLIRNGCAKTEFNLDSLQEIL